LRVAAPEEAPATTALRVLAGVLLLELIWLLLVASALIFLAAHLGSGPDEFTGDEVSRRLLLITVPPIAVVVALALIGARQAVDRRAPSPDTPLTPMLRVALCVSALANVALVVSIATSLYHARTTWLIVGLGMAAAFSAVAVACVRVARR
jgi:hypothetical protein